MGSDRRAGTGVRYSYLPQQFADPDEILNEIRRHLATCQFTLGPDVERFETSFAKLIGTRYAIGVGSGTDAIMLVLKALGIGPGDEVITAANTFIATVSAIHAAGARPVLVDVTDYYTLDPGLLEAAISGRTKAIVPVHLTGEPCDMTAIMDIAGRHSLHVVEDACQSILASIDGRPTGTFGVAAAYSLHPLKNLNVWGDAGVVVTSDAHVNDQLRLLRNHGLRNRDEIEILGHNSRLDSIQAIVGNWLIGQVREITEQRIANAEYYDKGLADLHPRLRLPYRRPHARRVYHLYVVQVDRRDELLSFLLEHGVEAKVHYPIPLPLQKALSHLGYRPGDFPHTERQARDTITFPVDQHLSRQEMDQVLDLLHEFYRTH